MTILYPQKSKMGIISFSSPSAIMGSKYLGGNRINWNYWTFWYIELQANFKRCILQTILHVYICVEQNLLF